MPGGEPQVARKRSSTMEIGTRTKSMSPFPLRCPSCDHGNPVSAKFCNNCGLPVHLQPCGNCEAINDRAANRCYKCGSPLSLMPVLQPRLAIPAGNTIASSSSAHRATADAGAPASEPAIAHPDTLASSSSADRTTADAGARVSEPIIADADTIASSWSARRTTADAGALASEPPIAHAGTLASSSSANRTTADAGAPVSEPAIANADTMAPSSSADRAIADPAPPVPRESQRHFYDVTTDGGEAAVSRAAEHTITVDETLATSPLQATHEGVAAPVARSDWQLIEAVVAKRRKPGRRATGIAVMLIALAVPAYLAYEDPVQLRQQFDAFTTRFDKPSALTQSPQALTADNPASQLGEAGPAPQSQQGAAVSSGSPFAEAAGNASPSPAASTGSEPQPLPPNASGESKLSTPEGRATTQPQAVKNARQSSVRSSASRSKQSSVSRTAASAKASDARTRTKGSDARRSESKEKSEKAASRRVSTRLGRSPVAVEPAPGESSTSTLTTR